MTKEEPKYQVRPDVSLPTLIPYSERIYPKKKRIKDKSDWTWRVDYDLTYDGGGAQFSLYYRSRFGALWSAFWHERVRSWGGSAYLIHQPSEPKEHKLKVARDQSKG